MELGANFSQEEAERLESSLAKDDSENLDLITQRIIGQQEAAAGADAPLKPRLPEDGKRVELTGAVQVEPNAEMKVAFTAVPVRPAGDRASLAYAAALAVCVFAAAHVVGALRGAMRPASATEDAGAKRVLAESAVAGPGDDDEGPEDGGSAPVGV